jgi:hypothetical protein
MWQITNQNKVTQSDEVKIISNYVLFEADDVWVGVDFETVKLWYEKMKSLQRNRPTQTTSS